MWKLVKAELDYVKPWILTSSIIFLLLITFDKFTLGRFNIYYMGMFLIPYIILTCIFINFGMFLREVSENRLRNYASVPISIVEIGLARILIPVSLIGIYFILAVLNVPSILEELLDFWILGNFYGSGDHYSWFNFIPYTGHNNALTLMTLFVIGPRIFAEKPGRLLLALIALLLIIHGYILPFINKSIALFIGDKIFYFFTGHFTEIIGMTLISALSLLVIFISTLRRRSFLEL